MKTMELWHFFLSAEMMISKLKDPEIIRRGEKRLAKEKARSIAEEIFPQIGEGSGESGFIKDGLPSIFHWAEHSPGEVVPEIMDAFDLYKTSLPPNLSFLLDRYELKDVVIKVVGVGSVGNSCWIALLMTGDGDPLFIQAKALSHARSGDAAMLSGYMGNNDTFDLAIEKFSFAYADQIEKDHASFMKAIKSGKIEAIFEE